MNYAILTQKFLKGFLPLLLFNLSIFIFGIFLIEASFRSYFFISSCLSSKCNGSYIKNIKIIDMGENYFSKLIGLTRYDKVVGYVPTENFSNTISAYGWNNSFVSISKDGFRNTFDNKPLSKYKGLAVGDSFTFGDQVSNSETWVACLEKKMALPIYNAGVPGYGAAQSLLRVQDKYSTKKYDYLFFSILVGSDLSRDQLSYRYGLAKPALVKSNGSLIWLPPPNPNIPGSIYNPTKPNTFLIYILERSVALQVSLGNNMDLFNFIGDKLTIKADHAASLPEILNWTISNFQAFQAKYKFLILHYPANYTNKDINKERAEILRLATNNSLQIIDTYPAISFGDISQIWDGHYTPYGNNLICNYIHKKIAQRE
jgi:hypothetical protein